MRSVNREIFTKPLKFIVCSYLSDEKTISYAVKAGASFFIKKPANIDIIYQRIKETLFDNINIEVKTKEDRMMMQTIKNASRNVDEKINSILLALGIPGHIKGFKNIKDAVKLVIDDYNLINYITKELYPKVAEMNNTVASRVERAIRHAIDVASNKNKFENLNKMFGIKLYGSLDKPTNGELIALIANKVITDGAS